MKFINRTVAILLALSLIYIGIYFIVEIRPHVSEMDEMIREYETDSLNYSSIKSMAVAEEGIDGIGSYVGHSLAVSNVGSGFRGAWHLLGLHWQLWVRLLYSEDEIFRLWLAMVPYGDGRGMKDAAQFHFESDLDSLSCYQLAQLVVMVRAPSMFKPGSERSINRIRDHGVAIRCDS